mmetsp:Transcript_35667/g.48160  ORF Transcript_35667/g.48160 Transcript_35667/m.48160 type:complete len:287 (-) Transcript_35667:264-1124(-)|eukprot:CAMPEP_0185768308 /NCGR_PEP_ID=MMETSP1174-20130828/48918_1 /TAXON_ID=35687 /ORGANISM="Dictyocha speculum, Strain CCMP1381" /LENGTH=286 /DNA_ID=CAMNT_0028452931 /DNA_START=9 /DNA_END=869 /DNA_ORIENTATION=+
MITTRIATRWRPTSRLVFAARSFSDEGISIGEYSYITAERRNKTGLVTLNRPKVNAVSSGLLGDVIHACKAFDADDSVGAMVITGNEKFFSGGADIKEMSQKTYPDAIATNMFADWDFVTGLSKPVIAAVNGYALGGGCELAMMCDIMIAGDSAKFGQPEIKLGVIPGCGGTQRLTRAVGKSKAMEMILTGRLMSAKEAQLYGLVAGVYPSADLVDEALKMSEEISAFSRPVVSLAKETVNSTEELSLREGLKLERRLFHSLFALDDQKEGMKAFIEKRPAEFTHS